MGFCDELQRTSLAAQEAAATAPEVEPQELPALSWGPGDKVQYLSSGHGWINAKVIGQNPDGSYNLNAKKRVPAEKIRARSDAATKAPAAVQAPAAVEAPALEPASPQAALAPATASENAVLRSALSAARGDFASSDREVSGKEADGFLERGINAVEKLIGVDLNGDGTIGGEATACASPPNCGSGAVDDSSGARRAWEGKGRMGGSE
mmetsp:Transcript_64654/g.138507  ORF Transcript_64654/g.138507 Transcript_64654/m.138507 type:complete len:208 (-) Transcript_64654:49-672(-)